MCKPCALQRHVRYWGPPRCWRRQTFESFNVGQSSAFQCVLCRELSWPAQRLAVVPSSAAATAAVEEEREEEEAWETDKEEEEEDTANKCVICYVRDRTIIQFPCGHWALCHVCALKQHERQCLDGKVWTHWQYTFWVSHFKAFPCPRCGALAWPASLFHA